MSITGSDSTGGAGIQTDIQTITAMGGYALSAITSITVQGADGMHKVHDLPCEMVVEQIESIFDNMHPVAVKVGLVRNPEVVIALRRQIVGCRYVVCAPGIMSSRGERLLDDVAIDVLAKYLLPISTLLMLRCNEAELMLGCSISTSDDMLKAARALVEKGAGAVMLRGGHLQEGYLTALLYVGKKNTHQFFTSPNTEGWQMHGVGGALSTAIATRLALGDGIEDAVSNAHVYMRNRVVYSAQSATQSLRHIEIYNKLMSLIAAHFSEAHDVAYYADALSVSPRYLSQITGRVVSKSPRQVIADYVANEAEQLLTNTELNIQEVANKLGFTSQALFCKFFKQQKGMSPSDWRK